MREAPIFRETICDCPNVSHSDLDLIIRGGGTHGLGSCGPDLDCGIGGGGGDIIYLRSSHISAHSKLKML